MEYTQKEKFQNFKQSVFSEPLPTLSDDIIAMITEEGLTLNTFYNLIGFKRATLASVISGGKKIYIPIEDVQEDSPLIEIFGRDAVKRLSLFFKGEEYLLPTRLGKSVIIYSAYLYGISQIKIATALMMCLSTVGGVIKKIKNDKGIYSRGYFYPLALTEQEVQAYAQIVINNMGGYLICR